MPFEITFVLTFLILTLVIYVVGTAFLALWTGQKLRNTISGAGLEFKGFLDVLCIVGVALNFALVLPLGVIACFFCKPTTVKPNQHA